MQEEQGKKLTGPELAADILRRHPDFTPIPTPEQIYAEVCSHLAKAVAAWNVRRTTPVTRDEVRAMIKEENANFRKHMLAIDPNAEFNVVEQEGRPSNMQERAEFISLSNAESWCFGYNVSKYQFDEQGTLQHGCVITLEVNHDFIRPPENGPFREKSA